VPRRHQEQVHSFWCTYSFMRRVCKRSGWNRKTNRLNQAIHIPRMLSWTAFFRQQTFVCIFQGIRTNRCKRRLTSGFTSLMSALTSLQESYNRKRTPTRLSGVVFVVNPVYVKHSLTTQIHSMERDNSFCCAILPCQLVHTASKNPIAFKSCQIYRLDHSRERLSIDTSPGCSDH
jgi:hypothetical protein